MLSDRYGLELTTTSTEARDLYVQGIDKMLAADAHIEETLEAAIAADPEFALAHAALARQHQLMMRGTPARAAIETAGEFVGAATPREQQHVAIISALLTGQVPRSLELTREHLVDYPRDAFALAPATGVFGSIGFSGCIDREAEHLALLEPLATHYGDDWWFQTVYAFALLETGEWARGRELAERSLEQHPTNSHGAHTLAHALFEAGADDEAADFMGGFLATADHASLMHCHNWWHYSMLLLQTGEFDQAHEAFSSNCLPGASDSPAINVFTDSVSFLWQAELAGQPRNRDLWEQVLRFYEASFRRPIVYVDAHVGFMFAALGDAEALDATIAQLHELAAAEKLPAGSTAALLTEGYRAFGEQRWADAAELLAPVMPDVVRIGGSRAQRNLQSNTLLAAYVNDDRADVARAFVAAETDRQPVRLIAGFRAG